ncbi:Asparaginyl-tRNA synthetase [Deinococcus proteolyticus MRP]|uniref:Asparagine--tRNA ligase n=1 Tax=Deinococcus proteolyticus (strain ATCC 35074 / DSM 20540 / JCM 6276 / NBRC 101906 / NCIMB 13154 / VKM Ac-1939 / CCM 2703 / MRP) TaxID=693977 RepID=F0RMU4_DEIPM|nr:MULTISPECIES: asparagine--tRNA ligase [Deinococcus]ADY26086.1 Asparaginyl-tRNA synthetase [Deinococcus proteolyticus MRP]MCY1702206.1 asparagine--tRNA ligase [Deinococcus sp. SL84]
MQISDLPHHIGETVTLTVWLQDKSGKGKIQFLKLRDGSGFVQGTVFKGDVSEEVFEAAKRLSQEQSLTLTGEVRADERAPSGVEISVRDLSPLSEVVGEYPITPKEHGIDFLLDHRHLWFRHRRPWAVMRVRDCVQSGIVEFFRQEGFTRFDAPFFTPNAAEGTTELFEIDLFGEDKAYLSQTGQLHAEAGALAFGKVYTFGPTFRAEKSKTRRHLLEFWMVEPEVAPATHQDNMDLQERFVSFLVRRVLDECRQELELLGRDVSKLAGAAEGNYPRITYTEALDIIRRHIEEGDLPDNVQADVQPVEWGDDFGAPHETILGYHFDRPVMVERYPASFKAFYMQPDPADPRLALCDDMIAPEGYGEIIGGSERIHDFDLLKERIEGEGLPLEAFEWYLDLRRYGSVPHAGFGMGLERFIAWMTGIDHIREAIPFPRMLTRMFP